MIIPVLDVETDSRLQIQHADEYGQAALAESTFTTATNTSFHTTFLDGRKAR